MMAAVDPEKVVHRFEEEEDEDDCFEALKAAIAHYLPSTDTPAFLKKVDEMKQRLPILKACRSWEDQQLLFWLKEAFPQWHSFEVINLTMAMRATGWNRSPKRSPKRQKSSSTSSPCLSYRDMGPGSLGLKVDCEGLELPDDWSWHRLLGQGRTSVVYEVSHNDVRYALKIPREGLRLKDDYVFLRALQDVEGVPTLHSRQGEKLVIMPVGECFSRKTVRSHGLKHSLVQLVDILQAAHSKHVVNRDVRMENIMIANNRFYILDWGYAAALGVPCPFAGCLYTTSDQILTQIVETKDEGVVYHAADDLVALIRCLFLFFQEDVDESLKNLYSMTSHSEWPAVLMAFWHDQMSRNVTWQNAEHKAKVGDYDAVRASLAPLGGYL